MEIIITSKQMVKPCSSKIHLLKPFKLSLLDQLSSTNYVSAIYFYTKPSDSQFSNQLKLSLSKALTQFYPLAGRIRNNLFISDYDEGVPFVETRVKGQLLSNFIEQTRDELEAMNRLLPCRPFRSLLEYSMAPLLSVQVNIFDCGGIALSLCAFHKICDATTMSAFLKCWTAFSRGSNCEQLIPNLLEASSRFFPPTESIVPTISDATGLWFNEGRIIKTRCFVFDSNAVANLMFKAKSKNLEHPSRVVALTAFIWKHAIHASRSVSGTSKPVFLGQAVNIRQRMKPQLPDYSIGNMHLFPVTTYNPVGKDIELTELAYLLREAVESVTNNSQDFLQAFKTIIQQLSQITEIVSKGNAEFYTSISWLNFLDGKDDFGWGKPTLFSIPGIDSHNPEFNNCFCLKKARQHNAIEAWVTLSDKDMDFLEHDPEFLAFASPSPYFDKIKM